MADFTHYKGTDRGFYVDWTLSGSPLNISGATSIVVNFKRKVTDADGAAVLTKTLAGGGVTVTSPTNRANIIMDEADFASLSQPETELQAGMTVVLSGRTYKKPFSVNVAVVP